MNHDLIVIGGGIIGLMSAAEFKRRFPEKRVLCIEAGAPANYASAGENRAFRHRHADPEYIIRAKHSLELWGRWQELFGKKFIHSSGQLFYSETPEIEIEKLANSGVRIEKLNREQALEIHPVFRPAHDVYLFDSKAGWIDSQSIIKSLIHFLGDSLLINEQVTDTTSEYVTTTKGKYETNHLILAAGPGNFDFNKKLNIVLPEFSLDYHLRPSFLYNQDNFLDIDFPTLSDSAEHKYYSVPVSGGQAVGLSYPYGSVSNQKDIPKLLSIIEKFVDKNLPGLQPVFSGELRVCPSLTLKKEGRRGSDDFVIERSPEGRSQAVLGGNIFKFAPWIANKLIDNIKS